MKGLTGERYHVLQFWEPEGHNQRSRRLKGPGQGIIVALCPDLGSKLDPISAPSACQEAELHPGNSSL